MQCKDIQKKALSHTRSKSENIIVEFIKSFYDKEIIINTRKVLKKYELDIYLPDIKLAIEYNGIRYHSIELYKPKDRILKKSATVQVKPVMLALPLFADVQNNPKTNTDWYTIEYKDIRGY